jgi:hypothetical protein
MAQVVVIVHAFHCTSCEMMSIYTWEHIQWKPTSSCKLCKLKSESHDLDPRESSWELEGVICKIHGRWEAWFAKMILQITPPTSSERPVGSTSCDSDWSFYSLHGEVGFHLICCLYTLPVTATVANMASYAISPSLILVMNDNMIIGTHHIVLACLCRHL